MTFFRGVRSSCAEWKLQTSQSCTTGVPAFHIFLQFPVQTELWLCIYKTNVTQAPGKSIYAVAYRLTQGVPTCSHLHNRLQGLSLRELAGFLVHGHAKLSQACSRSSFWLGLASKKCCQHILHLKESNSGGTFL